MTEGEKKHIIRTQEKDKQRKQRTIQRKSTFSITSKSKTQKMQARLPIQ